MSPPSTERRMRRSEALLACLSGVGLTPLFCLILSGGEAVQILSRGTAAMLVVAGGLLALVAALHRVASPPGIFRRFAQAEAFDRWAAHRCPACDHPMPPKRFDGPCPECGAHFARPELRAPSRLASFRFAALSVGFAILLALVWLAADVAAFRAEAARHPGQTYTRARWWPGGFGHFISDGRGGIRAND